MREAQTHKHNHAGHEHPGADCCGHEARPAARPAFRGGRVYKVRGMDCAEEVAVLKQAVGPRVGGADRLAFDVLNGRMTVFEGATPISAGAIREAVRRTGMSAVEWHPEKKETRDAGDRHRRQQVWFTSLSGLCVVVGFAIHVWLAGGFGEAVRLLAGHDGRSMPPPEVIAYALAVAFGILFVVVCSSEFLAQFVFVELLVEFIHFAVELVVEEVIDLIVAAGAVELVDFFAVLE